MHVVNGVAAAVSYFLFSLTRLNSLKTRTLNVKWCIRTVFKTMFLKFELLIKKISMDLKWCILALFKTMFWKFELLRKLWKQGENVEHSDTIWNDVLEVWAAEKKRTWNGVFWRSLKRCIVSWKCWEHVKSKGEQQCFGIWNWSEIVEVMDDRWCILTLFETMFLKFELLRKLWKQEEKRGAFWCYLKRCFGIWDCFENLEIMDDRWCILTIFLEVGTD